MDYEKRVKNMEGCISEWAKNHGSFAEEYFYNALKNSQSVFFKINQK